MMTKFLKKLAGMLSRNEGISLTPIIAIMVIMSVMGGFFTSIMGGWKLSAPVTINSSKAFYLAEAAAMFALQDAQYRFYSKDSGGNALFDYGTSTADPYLVSSVTTGNIKETADCWFEMPDSNDDSFSGPNDDNVNDDDDDSSGSTRHTIIATGTVTVGSGSDTLAKRQVKILADIIPSPANTVAPGVQTTDLLLVGGIQGPVSGVFGIDNGATVTYNAGLNSISTGAEAGVIIRPESISTLNGFDKYFVKALATDQGNYHPASYTVTLPNYPNSSFYYDSGNTMPNFIYVEGDFAVNAARNVNGVVWVTGDVTLVDTLLNHAIIICEGNGSNTYDFDFDDTGPNITSIDGGIILLSDGIIRGNENATAITVNQPYYNALNAIIPDISIVSWQEAVSNF